MVTSPFQIRTPHLSFEIPLSVSPHNLRFLEETVDRTIRDYEVVGPPDDDRVLLESVASALVDANLRTVPRHAKPEVTLREA